MKKEEQKTIFPSAIQKLHERNAKIKEEIHKLASQHPRVETEFKNPVKVEVDLKTIDAINNTDVATAHLTKNYHQLSGNLGRTRDMFDHNLMMLSNSP